MLLKIRRNSMTKETKPKATTKRAAKPAVTPESREQQLANLAVNLAEEQLRNGTASSAVITHYLKVASRREVLERDILRKQSELIEAKAQNMNRDREVEELAKAAIEAMKSYSPSQ